MGEEREVLEHHRDVLAAHLANGCGVRLREVGASNDDFTRGRLPEAVEHADEGGLARTGQAHDDEDLARLHVKGRVNDGRCDVLGELFGGDAARELLGGIACAAAEHLRGAADGNDGI